MQFSSIALGHKKERKKETERPLLLPAPAITTLSGLAGRALAASDELSCAASTNGPELSMSGRG